MINRKQGDSLDVHRLQAHKLAAEGVALIARALNHCSRQEEQYRYTEAVQARFFDLGAEVARLVEHGDIEVNPAHELYRRAVQAKSDKTLQQVLQRAVKRRGKRGAAGFKGQSS